MDLIPAAQHRAPAQAGTVYLVGAGPGDPELLTLRAARLIGEADVLVYDNLVAAAVLALARAAAERIYVGKRSAQHALPQAEINALLVRLARTGQRVVRLKGGDPFVFGRGGEELQHLQAHGVAYEVVPGISAAMACAAYSGIPLTHRDHAAALTFVTGHGSTSRPGDSDSAATHWKAIAGPGRTAVIYMGLKQAGKIRAELLRAGISASLPLALVANGSMESQQVLHGTVDELARLASRVEAGSPTLLIIGQVAALGSSLSWFKNSPGLLIAA